MINLLLKKKAFPLCSLILSLVLGTSAYAKPELKPLAANIADRGSDYYQFKVQNFQSLDQQRDYKVWLAMPKNSDKHKALPVIYMLDGNSVMSRLDDDLLKKMSEQNNMVIVAIGYKSNLPFESAARSVDYTPADLSNKIHLDPRNPERMSGGSQQFRQLISNQIIPWVNAQVKLSHITLDSHRTALWGHSYGGLFVLDTLLNNFQIKNSENKSVFSHYYVASPSLTWADSRILKAVEHVRSEQVKGSQLVVMEGDTIPSETARISPNADRLMIQNNRQLVLDLASKGVNAKLLLYPHLSHGQVFQASLMDVLNHSLF